AAGVEFHFAPRRTEVGNRAGLQGRGTVMRAFMFAMLAVVACSPVSPPTTTTGGGTGGGSATCTPKTCTDLGAQCGGTPDGCGGMLVSCGNCPAGQLCGGGGPNKCGATACTPKTCAQLSAACGAFSDGCGAALDCGQCAAGSTCDTSGRCI